MTMASLCHSQDSLSVLTGRNDIISATSLKLTRELSLSNQQQKLLHPILDNRWNDLAKTGQKPTNRQSIDQKTITDLKKILTEEQFALFLKLRTEKSIAKQKYLSEHPGYVFSPQDADLEF